MTSGPRILDSKDLYWLAGYLEGEGCFLRPSPSTPTIPKIMAVSTDRDVIERVGRFFGVSYIFHKKPSKSHWKDSYRVASTGKNAVKIMASIYPIMGKRRQEQIRVASNDMAINDQPVMEEFMFYWMVGLLEAEGSFMKSTASKPSQVVVKVHMTDQDVMERIGAMLDVSVGGPFTREGKYWKPYYKPFFVLTKSNRPAFELMQAIKPYMGERRQNQIDAAMSSYSPCPDRYIKISGENNCNAKLTAEQVREIRSRLAEGEGLTPLAKEFNVGVGLIWKIKVRQSWKHID